MRLLITFIVTSACLAGCATGPLNIPGTFLPPQHYVKLTVTDPCCVSYGDMQYVKLNIDEEMKATLSPESPVFEFSDGKSFFSAYELPSNAGSIHLKTYPVNMLLNRFGHVLIPAVQFLDERHQLIKQIKSTYISRSPRVVGDSWGEAEVIVPLAARYLILLDSKSPTGLAWRDRDQRSGYLAVRSGPTGEVSVLVRNR